MGSLWATSPVKVSKDRRRIQYRKAPKVRTVVITPPSDAYFTVTDVQPITDGSGIPKVKVRATFKCKISTGVGGNTLSNGVFVGIFGKSHP